MAVSGEVQGVIEPEKRQCDYIKTEKPWATGRLLWYTALGGDFELQEEWPLLPVGHRNWMCVLSYSSKLNISGCCCCH